MYSLWYTTSGLIMAEVSAISTGARLKQNAREKYGREKEGIEAWRWCSAFAVSLKSGVIRSASDQRMTEWMKNISSTVGHTNVRSTQKLMLGEPGGVERSVRREKHLGTRMWWLTQIWNVEKNKKGGFFKTNNFCLWQCGGLCSHHPMKNV